MDNLNKMYFNKLLDNNDYEISSYVKKYFLVNSSYPIKLHVGCDSQNISNHTNYATTVLFHIGNTGCHFLYYKERLSKIEDMWTKLWGEATRSVEVAIYLKERGIKVDSIDLDFNSDESYQSNKLVSASVGFVESMGFTANVKPTILPAISAADMMC